MSYIITAAGMLGLAVMFTFSTFMLIAALAAITLKELRLGFVCFVAATLSLAGALALMGVPL